MRRSALLIALALAATAAVPQAASADVDRAEARRIALDVLKPEKVKSPPGVVVFGLPRPLGADQTVNDAGIRRGRNAQTDRVRAIGRRAWLFWADLEYPAKFTHPSRLLLIDAESGRVLRRQSLQWWPLIDGKDPAFIRNRGSGDARWRVFSSAKPFVKPRPRARAAQAGKLGPTAFSDTCVIALSDKAKESKAVLEYFEKHGAKGYSQSALPLPTGAAKGSAPDGTSLVVFVATIVARCPDIVIYLSGHGNGEEVTIGKKTVQVKKRLEKDPKTGKNVPVYEQQKKDSSISPKDLKAIFAAHPRTTFKVIVDACHSGTFAEFTETNLKVATTATGTGDKEKTMSGVIGLDEFTDDLLEHFEALEGEVAADQSGESKAARIIALGGAKAQREPFDWLHLIGLAHVQLQTHMLPYSLTPPALPAVAPAPALAAPAPSGGGTLPGTGTFTPLTLEEIQQNAPTDRDRQFLLEFEGSVGPYQYVVDYGDGTSQQGPASGGSVALSHQYPIGPGTYTVRITITDAGGTSRFKEAQVSIPAPDPPPKASTCDLTGSVQTIGGGPRFVVSGSCDGEFDKLRFEPQGGVQFDGAFDVAHASDSPGCPDVTVSLIECIMKLASGNPSHFVDASFVVTPAPATGQQMELTFLDGADGVLLTRTVTIP